MLVANNCRFGGKLDLVGRQLAWHDHTTTTVVPSRVLYPRKKRTKILKPVLYTCKSHIVTRVPLTYTWHGTFCTVCAVTAAKKPRI